MASKLSAACAEVESMIDDLILGAGEHLEARIDHGSILEIAIPKALKDGTFNGTTLEKWKAMSVDYEKKRVAKVATCQRYIASLTKMLDALDEQVKKYNPEYKKTQKLSDKMLPAERQAVREKKKKAAMELIKQGRELVGDVGKQIHA